MDEKRHINEVFPSDENVHKMEESEQMDTVISPNKRRNKKLYANKLMLSEWLLEKPFDFEEKWLMKVCCTGVRNLVVANKVCLKYLNLLFL